MRNIKPLKILIVLLVGLSVSQITSGQSNYFNNWPAGTSPKEIGQRLAENFAARDLEFQSGKREFVIYPEACAWYGSLKVAGELHDRDLTDRLVHKFNILLTADGAKHISQQAHVDYSVFGIIPLELYLQTNDKKYLDLGKSFADKQWQKTTGDDITAEARYWIDDMYMITALQTHAFRATHDQKYLDRAARTMAAYLDKLQQPNGLFFHAPDAQFYWSRGNGWEAAGMAELLSDLPKNHPLRKRIVDGYNKMMEALLKYQGEDGLWHQLIDHPESWAETSGTGMFTFAMITGVRKGWLPAKTYGPAARKAWLALVKHIDDKANVTDVCEGTNKGSSVQYYLDRKRLTGDLHGQAAALWSAMALLR